LMSELSLSIENRNGKSLGTINCFADNTVRELKELFYKTNRKYYPDRIWFTIGDESNKTVLRDSKKLKEYGLKNGQVVIFKDLGPQISWKLVFLIEYFGPIFIHSLVYWCPTLFYGKEANREYQFTQQVAYWCVILHYLKREFETLFVHRFSNATMPFFNVFKNSTHYWIIGGIMIAYFVYHPLYTAPFSDNVVIVLAIIFFLAELGNLMSHISLRNLRPEGTTTRGIPTGGLFNLVSCANYTYELLAWLAFSIFTQTLTSYIFLLVSFVQIQEWALKKHSQYKSEFGQTHPQVKKRKALIPFIL